MTIFIAYGICILCISYFIQKRCIRSPHRLVRLIPTVVYFLLAICCFLWIYRSFHGESLWQKEADLFSYYIGPPIEMLSCIILFSFSAIGLLSAWIVYGISSMHQKQKDKKNNIVRNINKGGLL